MAAKGSPPGSTRGHTALEQPACGMLACQHRHGCHPSKLLPDLIPTQPVSTRAPVCCCRAPSKATTWLPAHLLG